MTTEQQKEKSVFGWETDMLRQQNIAMEVAGAAKLTRRQAEDAVAATLESIMCALDRGERVTLNEFGSFHVKVRAERRQFNPSNGEYNMLPETLIPVFKPAKELARRLNCDVYVSARRQR